MNLSTRDLREPSFALSVGTALAEFELPPHALMLEVTETAALEDDALPGLHRLRELGVHLAMDDFGIGYSSLAHLKRLPITMLKIDRTFIRDICDDEADRAIVVSIVNVAKAFGLHVVAEGVENEEQAAFVTAQGCDVGQGFLYGRPMRFDALVSQLRGSRRPKLRLIERTA